MFLSVYKGNFLHDNPAYGFGVTLGLFLPLQLVTRPGPYPIPKPAPGKGGQCCFHTEQLRPLPCGWRPVLSTLWPHRLFLFGLQNGTLKAGWLINNTFIPHSSEPAELRPELGSGEDPVLACEVPTSPLSSHSRKSPFHKGTNPIPGGPTLMP